MSAPHLAGARKHLGGVGWGEFEWEGRGDRRVIASLS